MKKILLFLCLLNISVTFSQEDAWVYFTDKPNVAAHLADPTTILTQRAIARKTRHGIAIDARDIPVNSSYIQTIKNQPGITFYAKSKWFNAVHVRGTQAAISALTDLSFVSSVDFANKALNAKPLSLKSNKDLKQSYQVKKVSKFETAVDFTYGDTQNQIDMLQVGALHAQDYTADGLVIAVMDTGFPNVNTMGSFSRLRDAGKLLGGHNFVSPTTSYTDSGLHNHGTLVLSSMAGYVENQYVGTAPDASYYLFVTEDVAQENPVEESFWVEAVERADSLGVDVINTSLGYNTFDKPAYNYTTNDMDGQTAFMSKGANIAIEKGILVVCSAGNAGSDPNWGVITVPGDSNVYTVGAVDASEQYAFFSSKGPTADGRIKPDGTAQGQGSILINQYNTITSSNGTSFSGPILAGAIASFWQAFPDKKNTEIMQLVRESSSYYTTPNAQFGYGIPNFKTLLDNTLSINSVKDSVSSWYISKDKTKISFVFPTSYSNTKIKIQTLTGAVLLQVPVSTNQVSIDIGHLPQGVYIASISNNNTSLQHIKFVK